MVTEEIALQWHGTLHAVFLTPHFYSATEHTRGKDTIPVHTGFGLKTNVGYNWLALGLAEAGTR